MRMPRPPPPAARLDQDGKTNLRDKRPCSTRGIDSTGTSGHGRNSRARGHFAGSDLVAHLPNGLASRADKDQARILHGFHEARVLCQEAVTGMDGVRSAVVCRGENCLDVEVGFRRGRRADVHSLVGESDGERIGICLTACNHGAHAELPRRTNDPYGNLAAIRDQEAIDGHGRWRLA